jgi:hypothetical protein
MAHIEAAGVERLGRTRRMATPDTVSEKITDR